MILLRPHGRVLGSRLVAVVLSVTLPIVAPPASATADGGDLRRVRLAIVEESYGGRQHDSSALLQGTARSEFDLGSLLGRLEFTIEIPAWVATAPFEPFAVVWRPIAYLACGDPADVGDAAIASIGGPLDATGGEYYEIGCGGREWIGATRHVLVHPVCEAGRCRFSFALNLPVRQLARIAARPDEDTEMYVSTLGLAMQLAGLTERYGRVDSGALTPWETQLGTLGEPTTPVIHFSWTERRFPYTSVATAAERSLAAVLGKDDPGISVSEGRPPAVR
jgi:hypothetical protein